MAESLVKQSLPLDWSYGVTKDGRIFFISERRRQTSWLHPVTRRPVQTGHLSNAELPTGWEWDISAEGTVYFIDHNNQQTTACHPVTGRPATRETLLLLRNSQMATGAEKSAVKHQEVLTKINTSTKTSNMKPPSPKRNPGAQVIRQGYLYRQENAGISMTWKRRWCVLTDLAVFIYKEETEDTLLASILLPGYQIGLCQPADHIHRQFSFKVKHENTKVLFFHCEALADLNQWVSCLQMVAAMKISTRESLAASAAQTGFVDRILNPRCDARGWMNIHPAGYSSTSTDEAGVPSDDAAKQPVIVEQQGAVGMSKKSGLLSETERFRADGSPEAVQEKHQVRLGNDAGSLAYEHDNYPNIAQQHVHGMRSDRLLPVRGTYFQLWQNAYNPHSFGYCTTEKNSCRSLPDATFSGSASAGFHDVGVSGALSYVHSPSSHYVDDTGLQANYPCMDGASSLGKNGHSRFDSGYSQVRDFSSWNANRGNHVDKSVLLRSDQFRCTVHSPTDGSFSDISSNYHDRSLGSKQNLFHMNNSQDSYVYSNNCSPYVANDGQAPTATFPPRSDHHQSRSEEPLIHTYVNVPQAEQVISVAQRCRMNDSPPPSRPPYPSELRERMVLNLAESHSPNTPDSPMTAHQMVVDLDEAHGSSTADNPMTAHQMNKDRIRRATYFQCPSPHGASKSSGSSPGSWPYVKEEMMGGHGRWRNVAGHSPADDCDIPSIPDASFLNHSNISPNQDGDFMVSTAVPPSPSIHRGSNAATESRPTIEMVTAPCGFADSMWRSKDNLLKIRSDHQTLESVNEDDNEDDCHVLETTFKKKNMASRTNLRMSISADDLIGKTHDELVLLLIQLRRNQAVLESSWNYYHDTLSGRQSTDRPHNCIGQPEYAGSDQSNYTFACRQIDEVERKLNVYRPLINLVDNMVTMGSLYGGDNLKLAAQYRKHLLKPDQCQTPHEMMEFSRRYQEARVTLAADDHVRQLSSVNLMAIDESNPHLQSSIQDMMERVHYLEQFMQELTSRVFNFREDKDVLETAVSGIVRQIQGGEYLARDYSRLQQELSSAEGELSVVTHELAEASKLLEQATVEYNNVVRQVALLKSKVRNELKRSKSAPSLGVDSPSTKMKMERELTHVNNLMKDLSQQGLKLSNQMDTIRRSISGQTVSATSHGVVNASSTYLETDVDTGYQLDMAQLGHTLITASAASTSIEQRHEDDAATDVEGVTASVNVKPNYLTNELDTKDMENGCLSFRDDQRHLCPRLEGCHDEVLGNKLPHSQSTADNFTRSEDSNSMSTKGDADASCVTVGGHKSTHYLPSLTRSLLLAPKPFKPYRDVSAVAWRHSSVGSGGVAAIGQHQRPPPHDLHRGPVLASPVSAIDSVCREDAGKPPDEETGKVLSFAGPLVDIGEVPDIVKSSLASMDPIDQLDVDTIDREILHFPEKVSIPERYDAEEDAESLTEEEKLKRQQKSERIKNILSNQTSLPVAQSTCYSMPGHCLRQRAKHEKQERANILSLKQELARQVSQETRRQAAKRRQTWSHGQIADVKVEYERARSYEDAGLSRVGPC